MKTSASERLCEWERTVRTGTDAARCRAEVARRHAAARASV
ncbi:hypothetical protein QTH97_23340 [Variovorax sp. J22R24]|nr:hypothetical protein [Variovorax sp. J22R24]MDM0107901.1 hypothetical protein [Variovorax sp. J22R24]